MWRRVGLHRLRHQVDGVALAGGGLEVQARVAPAATDLGVAVAYRWSAVEGELRLEVEVAPEGDWPCPWPRLGLRMAVPAGFRNVEWFGRGPGEACADTGRAARVGRFAATVEGSDPVPVPAGERQPPRRALGHRGRRRARDPVRGASRPST